MRSQAAAVLIVALAGCALTEPPVPGGWATYTDMSVYYRRNAWEWDGRCRMPYLDGVLKADVVSETDEQLTLLTRYFWRDQIGNTIDDFPGVAGINRCQGVEERTFVLAKQDDGSLETVSMSGLHRGGRIPSLMQ